MEIDIPISPRLSLAIADSAAREGAYPTARLQKGWLLRSGGVDLAEEAVGFGVPVLKQGLRTLFPGAVEIRLVRGGPRWSVSADYEMNLVEKIGRRGKRSIGSGVLYEAKIALAAFMMVHPPARGPLTAVSSALRRLFRWETSYEDAGPSAGVRMRYEFDEGARLLTMDAELAPAPLRGLTEVIIMNEQGARHFDRYWDSGGMQIAAKETGFWDEVQAQEATFASSTQGTAFTVHKVPGARLFRGRELIGSRLAWVGFGHSFPPAMQKFGCRVKIEGD